MAASRRNVLAYLGIVGASSPALCTEQLMEESAKMEGRAPKIAAVNFRKKHVATALRRVADGVESGDINVTEFTVSSSLERDKWLAQELKLEFELLAKEG